MERFFLPISIVLGLIVFWLAARWYLVPALQRRDRVEALTPLLLFHSFRYIGLTFLIPGVMAAPLDPAFAVPAAYGDLLAELLALIALLALRSRWAIAIPLVWLFNIEGSVDLLNALFQGFRLTPDASMGATWFIPAVVVPALLVTHVVVFQLLLRREPVAGS